MREVRYARTQTHTATLAATLSTYERVARRKGHQKAIGAVARHLAEATYWILTKQETYRERTQPPFRRRGISADNP
jgi:hypothetical protein